MRKRFVHRVRHLSWQMTLIICLLFILIPPTVAYGSTIFTYAQGYGGVGGVYGTTGYAARDFNRVYHQAGYYWNPFYCRTDGSCFGGTSGSSNPTYANGGASYAKAYCHNQTDNSGVLWTCQTTRP
jgi:hypothetical protein